MLYAYSRTKWTLSSRPVGDAPEHRPRELALAVVRGQEVLRFDDERTEDLQPGDRLICLCNRDE